MGVLELAHGGASFTHHGILTFLEGTDDQFAGAPPIIAEKVAAARRSSDMIEPVSLGNGLGPLEP